MSESKTERKALYTAQAHVTGGRAHGHRRTSDGALEVELRAPVEMGGEGGGTNPEQLFAVGYAEQAVALVRAAHQVCPYSHATRGTIEVTVTANGARVD